jgi:D-alanyl-D-alanine-carboxypeptidase/D-alanyl-D-alanine-endopeptidase
MARRLSVGAVVLSNAAWGVDDIGLHLLDANFPLEKQHTEVKVDTRLYDFYVGNYQLRPDFVLTISRDGNRLFGQATGQGEFEIFPESDRDYFCKDFDAQATFMTVGDGRATGLIWHQGGMDSHAKRVE